MCGSGAALAAPDLVALRFGDDLGQVWHRLFKFVLLLEGNKPVSLPHSSSVSRRLAAGLLDQTFPATQDHFNDLVWHGEAVSLTVVVNPL